MRRVPLIVVTACLAGACSDATRSCGYQGKVHAAGESFPAGDGCNTCQCDPETLQLRAGLFTGP